jgi:PadR family transcriptional regulator, regulatory protein AphA
VSLRHAVLGMLSSNPSTGYELAQRFDASLAHAWHASHSQIYPELGRLLDEGLIEVSGEGPRRSRTYAVTDAGREELRTWLVDTEPGRTQRNETAVRWFLMALLEPEDRRTVIERELAHVEAYAEQLRQIAERIDALPSPSPYRPTVDLGLRSQVVMREWLEEQLAATKPRRRRR